jgi:hypothetical protein
MNHLNPRCFCGYLARPNLSVADFKDETNSNICQPREERRTRGKGILAEEIAFLPMILSLRPLRLGSANLCGEKSVLDSSDDKFRVLL